MDMSSTDSSLREQDDFAGKLLHQAALWDNADLLEDLLCGDQVQYVNSQDLSGRTPLHAAVMTENSKCLRILLQVGADPNIACGVVGGSRTPLHVAALLGYINNLQLLSSYNASLEITDLDGFTAYDLAASSAQRECVELLKKLEIQSLETENMQVDFGSVENEISSPLSRKRLREEASSSSSAIINRFSCLTSAPSQKEQNIIYDYDNEISQVVAGDRQGSKMNKQNRSPNKNDMVNDRKTQLNALLGVLKDAFPMMKFEKLSAAIPSHSLIAFERFIHLPNYSDWLFGDRNLAAYRLRELFGQPETHGDAVIVSSCVDSDDNSYTTVLKKALPTLPFKILLSLLNASPINSSEGRDLRMSAIKYGTMNVVLACLAIFTYQPETVCWNDPITMDLKPRCEVALSKSKSSTKYKKRSYWAKGTGYGSGRCTGSNKVSLQITDRHLSDEKIVTILLQILARYMNSNVKLQDTPHSYYSEDLFSNKHQDESPILPPAFLNILKESCLISTLAGYLRNDSVMDMSLHIPLYRAILNVVRVMAVDSQLVKLMLPAEEKSFTLQVCEKKEQDDQKISIFELLQNMKSSVNDYCSLLEKNKTKRAPSTMSTMTVENVEEEENFSKLIEEIRTTASILESFSNLIRHPNNSENKKIFCEYTMQIFSTRKKDRIDYLLNLKEFLIIIFTMRPLSISKILMIISEKIASRNCLLSATTSSKSTVAVKSLEDIYMGMMKKLQFGSFDMFVEDENGRGCKFTVDYHFESVMRGNRNTQYPARMKRLAQEMVSLQKSLPLSLSSSVFVKCDTDRLDIMKVIITGPAETPYSDGCFEFDVYFPPSYPSIPMEMNLHTTGRRSVRFNPNLYNCGKVCLSVLNTWGGSKEERWNPTTSSLLQVLISIQSLILVPDPYFNEPGYESSRRTADGDKQSSKYNDNIRNATVQWAILDQIRNPSPCFKEIILTHFWLKRNQITNTVQKWIYEMQDRSSSMTSTLNKQFVELCKEFAKLSPPKGMEELSQEAQFQYPAPGNVASSNSNPSTSGASRNTSANLLAEKLPARQSLSKYEAATNNLATQSLSLQNTFPVSQALPATGISSFTPSNAYPSASTDSQENASWRFSGFQDNSSNFIYASNSAVADESNKFLGSTTSASPWTFSSSSSSYPSCNSMDSATLNEPFSISNSSWDYQYSFTSNNPSNNPISSSFSEYGVNVAGMPQVGNIPCNVETPSSNPIPASFSSQQQASDVNEFLNFSSQ